MKGVKVTELKAHLSAYLRQASLGTRIVVHDRDQPVALLGPLEPRAATWRDRLAGEGRLRRGSQAWNRLELTPLRPPIDVQRALRDVRDDPRDGSR